MRRRRGWEIRHEWWWWWWCGNGDCTVKGVIANQSQHSTLSRQTGNLIHRLCNVYKCPVVIVCVYDRRCGWFNLLRSYGIFDFVMLRLSGLWWRWIVYISFCFAKEVCVRHNTTIQYERWQNGYSVSDVYCLKMILFSLAL